MRKVLVVVLSLAVPGAGLSAPFLHVHPDDQTTAHHRGRVVHTHWSGHTESSHPSDTPAVGTEDHDRAIFLNAFVAVAAPVLFDLEAAQVVFEVPAPRERAAHRGVHVVRSHGPPFFRSLSPRAPPRPAFLS